MAEISRPDLCVLGGGAGGVAAASAAAAAGATVMLVESRRFEEGYPTTALIAHVLIDAARKLVSQRSDSLFGPPPFRSTPDMGALRQRVQRLAARQYFDSPTRLAALNVETVHGTGRFVGPKTLEAAGRTIEAERFIVAAGAEAPPSPAIKGWNLVRPFGLEALLALETWPKHVALLGGSAYGLALAQTLHRLGAEVHLIEAGSFLPDEDDELAALVLNQLRREGVVLHEATEVEQIEPRSGGLLIDLVERGSKLRLDVPHLMLMHPPVPRIEGLGLTEAQIDYDKQGIKVRSDLRTSNPQIYAIGDVIGGVQSHANARFQAHRVVEQIFGANRRNPAPPPRILFTDPEMAVVGLSETEARKMGQDIRVLRGRFHDNVAAQIVGECEGHVKIITDRQDRLLGAGIVGPQARELIGLFSLALSQRLNANDLRSFVPASPSLTEASRLAALALPSQFGKAFWRRIFPLPRRFK